MKKFTLKHVFEGFRSTVQTPASSAKAEQVAIVETLHSDNFQVAKTVRHGFPYQPTAVAFDPIQRVLAVATKHGSIRLIGRPGVDTHLKAEGESAAILHLLFLVNEGALVAATADDNIHLWNYRQKKPEIVHSLKFQRERITCLHLPFQSKWLYVGTERGNIHIVNIEVFQLSGYIINWNKAIELSRKTHPGPVLHLSDCPVDPSKLLIGYETGQLVIWDLKSRSAEVRYQSAEPLRSLSWHHEGKQFMCSHADGSLTTWTVKQSSPKPASVIFPHAKTNKEGKQDTCKPIPKVEWKTSKTGESFIIFSGGLANDRGGRTPSITVIHGKTTTVLEMEHSVVDFTTLCHSNYQSECAEPYALVVLLHNDLVVVDLLSPGYPCFENPYPMDLHESPVTCCSYIADCPADLIPALYSAGVRGGKRGGGFSEREWPISGGEWGAVSSSYAEMIITGHADGSIKFWDASSVTLQVLYKLKTAKVFEKPRSKSIDGDEDPFAIQHLFLCPESRLLCVAGSTAHVILFKYSKQETTAEISCLEIPIIYDVYGSADCSPEYEFPPRPSLQVGEKERRREGGGKEREGRKNGASVDYFVPIHVRGGSQKKPAGYQADLVCLTPWVDGEPPGAISALSINSSYGLLSYGNESGLVIVDYVAKSCLLNMGTPDLYGPADPYQRAPRSPKRTDGKEEERCKSPSSDQGVVVVGCSAFYLLHETDQRGKKEGGRRDLEGISRKESKEELRKRMSRKDSRGMEKGKEGKGGGGGGKEGKMEFLRLLGRKESRGRVKEDVRDGRAKEGSVQEVVVKDDQCEDNVKEEEWRAEEDQEEDDDVDEEEEDGGLEEEEAGGAGRGGEGGNKDHQRPKFRLREQFSKLDARFRKAFSSEFIPAPDAPVPDSPAPDHGQKGSVPETLSLETSPLQVPGTPEVQSPSDAEMEVEVAEEAVMGGVEDPGGAAQSLAVTPRASPSPRPSLRPRSSPVVESGDMVQEVVVSGQEGRASLTLFDDTGSPVPPPRTRPRLSQSRQRAVTLDPTTCLEALALVDPAPDSPGGEEGGESSPQTPAVAASPSTGGGLRALVTHITKRRSDLQDKLDGSFSRSRSSSISSLDNISSEAIQCLAFADSYTRKNADSQLAPTLWVGTSLGSVIQVMVSIPAQETRLSTPATVSPSASGHPTGTIFRLKGSVLAMSFLDCNGALIPYQYESWKEANKEKKLERTPTKTVVDNRMSPTNSSGGEQQTWGDRQFVVIASEKVARVVALPSQNCVYKQIITEISFVVKAEIVQIKDSVCLVCYVATGHISVFSLPSLRQLVYVDFLPLVDLRIARTFCFTNYGHGMYLCSPTEVQKFTLSADFCKDLQDMLGELFLPCDMPEPPKQSFFKGLFGGGISQLDREELFGESSGKGSRSVAKHVPGPTAQLEALNARAGNATSEISRAKMLALERGQKLGELEERTGRMMTESESLSNTAHSLLLRYKDKKWYQI